MAYAAVTCLIDTVEHLARFTHLLSVINMCTFNRTYNINSYRRFFEAPSELWCIDQRTSADFLFRYLDSGVIEKILKRSRGALGEMEGPSVESKCLNLQLLFRSPLRHTLLWDSKYNSMRYFSGTGDAGYNSKRYFSGKRVKRRGTIYSHDHLLEFLKASLKNFASTWNEHKRLKYLEGCIVDVAYTAQDLIEQFLFPIQPKVMNYLSSLLYPDPKIKTVPWVDVDTESETMPRVDVCAELDTIFNVRNGIIQALQPTIKELDSIRKEVEKINVEPLVTDKLKVDDPSLKDSSPRSTPTQTDEVIGFDDDFISILDNIIRESSRLEIIPIVGMGGIGKTTLARKIFDYPLTVHHFYVRAWVTVSQAHRVRDILLGLLRCFTELTDEKYRLSNEQLAENLYRSLKCKRYLIVMDDMWSTSAWDDVKRCFPDDRNGSRILLTARLGKVADYVNPKVPPFRLSLLDVDHSWKLLRHKVFGKESCPIELVDIGKRIARKCQGLPLAIVVVAGLLSQVSRTVDSWKGITDTVSAIVNTNPEQCIEILSLSYKHLPHHLKACFLYMGAFPEDCEIEVQKLVNLWIAEGFLDKKVEKCLEEVAEEYLNDLVDRSLVLAGKRCFSGKLRTCCIHDLLRELCLKEAKKEKFMRVIERDAQGFQKGLNIERRLIFHSDCFDNLDSAPSLPLVQSFLMFSIGFGSLPDLLFHLLAFKLLRVLDIMFLRTEYFPIQILELVQLRYLAFTASYDIPISISKLMNLQTLIVHGPWIRGEHGESPTLAFKYWTMPWLRHLHFSVACHFISPVIPEMVILHPWAPKSLQTLSTMRFASCNKEVFHVMPNLMKLGICETKEDCDTGRSSKCFSSLVHLPLLQELKCSFYKEHRNARRVLDSVSFPSTLRQLSLSWSYLQWEQMVSVSGLPNLEVLKLKNYAFEGPEWEPPEDGFRCLKQLLIDKNNLVHWRATSIHFPSLQRLVLRSCNFLEKIPIGVGVISSLQQIELHYCSESAEISAKEIQEQIEGLDIVIRSDWNRVLGLAEKKSHSVL